MFLSLSLSFTPSYTDVQEYKPRFNYYYGVKKEPKIVKKIEIAKPKNQPKTVVIQDKESYLIDTDQKLSKDEIVELIKFYSEKYKVDPDRSLRIAKCESGFNSNALSKSGKHKGLYQFLNSTFDANAKRLLKSDPEALNGKPNVFNPDHNIAVATYMFSINQYHQWGCK
jgi:soluble lytic murein transglycosylase-like protein